MWVFGSCSGLALLAAAWATLTGKLRHSVVALWLVGLAIGGIYLSVGAELLALVQWIISSAVAIAFSLYAVLMGEFWQSKPKNVDAEQKIHLRPIAAAVIGLLFAGILWMGAQSLNPLSLSSSPAGRAANETLSIGDSAAVGKVMIEEHLISLEVLGVMFFVVVIGAGVVARHDSEEPS